MTDSTTILQALHNLLAATEQQGWLVGGAVRDQLLGRQSHDLDLVITGDALAIAAELAAQTGGRFVPLDVKRNTARIVWPPHEVMPAWELDLVGLRAPTLAEDLRLRDFTINALAVPLAEVLGGWTSAVVIDPCGGQADLARGVIRACGPQALVDDPLRSLRAVRLAAQLDFELDPGLPDRMRAVQNTWGSIANERVRDELLKLLALPFAADWLDVLDEVGLLTTIIPELEPSRTCEQPGGYHCLPVLAHMLEAVRAWEWVEQQLRTLPRPQSARLPLGVQALPTLQIDLALGSALLERMSEHVDGIPRRALFKLALLLHDNAKPQTKAIKPNGGASFYDHQTIGATVALAIAQRLRISSAGAQYVAFVVAEHMRPGLLAELGERLTRRAVYRFFAATQAAGPDVLAHMLCDYLAMRGPNLLPERWTATLDWINAMLDHWYHTPEVVRPTPLISGRDVISELGITPGPQIGKLLAAVREAQACGEIETRAEALALVRQLLAE